MSTDTLREPLGVVFRRFIQLVLFVAVLAWMVGCGDDGGGTKPEPTDYTLVVEAKEAGDALSVETFSFNGSTFGQNSSTASVTKEENTSGTVRLEKSGYDTGSQSVTFDGDKTITIEMTPEQTEPETATLTVDPRFGGSTYSDAVLTNTANDEEIGDGGKEDIDGEIGSELEIEISGPDVKSVTRTLVFDETKTVPVELEEAEPETVTLSITPKIGQFDARARGGQYDQETSYELTVGAETFTNRGPNGAQLQEGQAVEVEVTPGESITISGRFIYVQKDRKISTFFHRSLATGETSLTPDGDSSVTLDLQHQPACSDGIDNDLVDGAGNDETAVGCVADDSPTFEVDNPEWVYDASDDDERLLFSRKSYNLQKKSLYFVSSKDGERRVPLLGNDFPEDVKFALGEILFYLDNKIEQAQTGESFALELQCGVENSPASEKTSRLSDVIPDNFDIDGWRESTLRGFTRDHFKNNGVECNVLLQHGSLARGEKAGDGNDDVVVRTEERTINLRRVFAVEPESLPEELRPEASTSRRYFNEPLR